MPELGGEAPAASGADIRRRGVKWCYGLFLLLQVGRELSVMLVDGNRSDGESQGESGMVWG